MTDEEVNLEARDLLIQIMTARFADDMALAISLVMTYPYPQVLAWQAAGLVEGLSRLVAAGSVYSDVPGHMLTVQKWWEGFALSWASRDTDQGDMP